MTRHMVPGWLLIVGICLFAAIGPAVAASFDAVADFSDSSNPNGAWAYHHWQPYMTFLPNSGDYQGDTNVGGWMDSTAGTPPYVLKTRMTEEYVKDGVHFLPDELVMKSNGANWSIVRWTVPEDGNYLWVIQYTGRQEDGATAVMAYCPRYGGWSGGTITYGQTAGFNSANQLLPLVTGDTFDLYIQGDAVGLKALFTTDAPTATITGVVTSNMPGNPPLAGVTVWVNAKSVTTDENGVYTVTGLLDGDFAIRFSKPGFTAVVETVSVVAGETLTLDVMLETSVLTGTVTSSEAGNPPIAHARVYATDADCETVTDAAGHYLLYVTPGDHSISFTRCGFEPATVSQTTTGGQSTTLDQQLTFVQEIWDAGYEFQAIENPSGDWTYGYFDTSWTFVNYTDATGPFAGVPYRQWTVPQEAGGAPGTVGGLIGKSWSDTEISTYGYNPPLPATWPHALAMHPSETGEMATMRWTAPRDMNVIVHARFSGTNPNGTTTDCHVYQNFYPLYDCTVSGFSGTYANNYEDASGTTPVCDKWLVATVFADDVLDFSVGYGTDPYDQTWINDLTGLIATIEPSATGPAYIDGYVYSAETAYGIEGATVQTADGRFTTTTDIYGYYQLTVPAGEVDLEAIKVNYATGEATVTLPEGGYANCDFLLVDGKLDGMVSDYDTGAPIAGARIFATDGEHETYSLDLGDYFITLAPGTYTFTAFFPGYEPLTEEVVVDGSVTQNFRLHKKTTIDADLADDFLVGVNPNGPWTYGYYTETDGVFADFVPYTSDNRASCVPGKVEGWGDTSASIALLAKNFTDAPVEWYGTFNAGGVNGHPGPTGQSPTARWIVPSAGRLLITASFEDAQVPTWGEGATVRGCVLLNGAVIGEGIVDHYNQPLSWSYSGVINAVADDQIDFVLSSNGNYSADMTKMNGHISVAPDPTPTTIAGLKTLPIGEYVSVTGTAICSGATFTDGFFIEDPDRIAGVKIVGGAGAADVLLGEAVTVTGVLSETAGQLYIQADSLDTASGTAVKPVGVANRSANTTTGLLTKVWGSVTSVDPAEAPSYFYIDDGSVAVDGSGNVGVRIDIANLASPDAARAVLVSLRSQIGTFVSVTGVVGTEATGLTVRPRTDTDINTD